MLVLISDKYFKILESLSTEIKIDLTQYLLVFIQGTSCINTFGRFGFLANPTYPNR